MEQQTPIPPKSRMKAREGQKRAIFPSLIWGGGGGGSRFSIYFVQDCSNLVAGGKESKLSIHDMIYRSFCDDDEFSLKELSVCESCFTRIKMVKFR